MVLRNVVLPGATITWGCYHTSYYALVATVTDSTRRLIFFFIPVTPVRCIL